MDVVMVEGTRRRSHASFLLQNYYTGKDEISVFAAIIAAAAVVDI